MAMQSIYKPRPHFGPLHQRRFRWFMMVAHRRAGKTVSAVNDLIERATYNTRESPRYAYIAPLLKQAKQIAWDYLKKYAAPFDPRINESELWVELQALPNSPRITIYGADNPDAFRGLYFDGVVLDEFGNMKMSVWKEVILPALIDRRGWAVFMGTPNGPNHFRDMWYEAEGNPEWGRLFLPASTTNIIPLSELEMMKRMMDPEEYAQEMECSFEASVRGAIYARQMDQVVVEQRIGSFKAERGFPVHIVSDLGFSDTCTWGFFQERPDGIVIDRAYGNNMQPISHYAEYIKKYFRETGHQRGVIWLPHDARAKSLQTGKSIVEQFIKHGLSPRIVPNLDVSDGIAAARQIFPSLFFNQPQTQTLVLALKSYHRKYDEDRKVYTDEPVHDWSSHWADMVRYLALVSKRAKQPGRRVPQELVDPADNGLHYGFALNDIWDCAPKPRNIRL